MRQEIIVRWMDASIEEWYRMRALRTLSDNCGSEFCTCLGFYSDMKFHINASGYERSNMEEMAAAVGAEIEVKDFDEKTDEISFYYKGFKFFALSRKESV